MDKALEPLRDAQISRLDGAVKYEPIIESMLAEELDKLSLPTKQSVTLDEAIALVVPNVFARQAEIEKIADDEHAKFIGQLKAEIANDPDGIGYKGMDDAAIASAMSQEVPYNLTLPGPSEMAQLIEAYLATLIVRPPNLAISATGTVLTDGYTAMQDDIDALVAKTGKQLEELIAPSERTLTTYKQAPCWRVIGGVKFGRNIVRVEEIAEARK